MRLQFGRLRGELVISDGIEAWVLTGTGWQSIDATMAFLKSDWIMPREARRIFGATLPDLPAEAFRGRDLKVANKRAPRIARARSN